MKALKVSKISTSLNVRIEALTRREEVGIAVYGGNNSVKRIDQHLLAKHVERWLSECRRSLDYSVWSNNCTSTNIEQF